MDTTILAGKDLLTTEGTTLEQLEIIMNHAHMMRNRCQRRLETGLFEGYPLLHRRVALAFFERSTRTYQSSLAAAQELGANVIGFADPSATSVGKGESWQDTIRTLACYNPSLLVIRHPDAGSAQIAADICDFPVVNAGDGANQHPTQAWLDVHSLAEYFGGFAGGGLVDLRVLKGKTIAICGDLKNGRTLHSGIPLYRLLGVNLILCAPDELQIPTPAGIICTHTDKLEIALSSADVIYMTRIQFERDGMENLQHLRGCYKLNRELIEQTNPKIAVTHPLPRVKDEDREIDEDVDGLPNALYFRLQTPCGMWTRMAIFDLLTRQAGN